jgi:DNA-binding MarR family transcriptional regulator
MVAKAKNDAGTHAAGTRGLGLLLARCRKRLWSAAQQELSGFGETVWRWQVLAHLDLGGRLTQNEVAISTGQHPGAISRLLAELEGEGMVLRRRDARDQRRIQVGLTRKGRGWMERRRPGIDVAIAAQFADFTPADLAELARLLGKLADGAVVAPARRKA